jgi:hypothetical protein
MAGSEWLDTLTTISAPLAGAVWGVALSPDFGKLSIKAKAWRWFLAVLFGTFFGPYILHRFFAESHPSAASFWLFASSAASLAVGPILLSRVMDIVKRFNLSPAPKDEA